MGPKGYGRLFKSGKEIEGYWSKYDESNSP